MLLFIKLLGILKGGFFFFVCFLFCFFFWSSFMFPEKLRRDRDIPNIPCSTYAQPPQLWTSFIRWYICYNWQIMWPTFHSFSWSSLLVLYGLWVWTSISIIIESYRVFSLAWKFSVLNPFLPCPPTPGTLTVSIVLHFPKYHQGNYTVCSLFKSDSFT